MHYKTNRVNHDFQIVYFLAGSCHTPDAAWSLLCDLREDRKMALDSSKAAELRTQAKIIRAMKQLENSTDSADCMEAEADLLEVKAFEEVTLRSIAAAEAELATIEKCMAALEPMRKYKGLPDAEAHEAAQAEEWRFHLMYTAQNYMIGQGSIPADQLATMRQHPDFNSHILPVIDQVNAQLQLARPSGKLANVPLLIEAPKFSLPALLK
jgi:hypothetical protein